MVVRNATYASMGRTKSPRSLTKGFLAGVVGGLAGAGVKLIAEQLFPPRVEGQAPPPVILAQQIAGRELPETQRKLAHHTIHWVFGALAGGVYGALVELEPSLSAWRGAAFGITLNRITHESLLPRMGLAASTGRQPTQERISEWITHAAYGVGTDTVRRAVRRGL
jgi:putative membrane protein